MELQTNSYICRYCKGSFDHVENLQKHVEQIHTPRPTKDKFKLCPLCGLRCAKYETYRDHLKHIHRLSEEGKVFLLKCFNDFHVWKNELEKRMYCKYIQQGQPKVTQFSKDKIYVYRCDSSTKEKKSSWAAKDTCPSTISAIENVTNHTVKVEHWNTHVGHAIPIEGEELDAAIGSLQTTEIIIDEQSYQSSDHDSQSGLCFLAENNDGSYSETFVKETNKKQPPSLFKNNGNSSMPRKFSFKKDPNKKSVSFSGSLASVACMKATVKKDSTPSGGKVTINTKSSPAMSSVVDSAYSKFVSDAKNIKSSTPVKTNSNNQRSGNAAAKQLASSKPSETLKSNLKHLVKDEKLNGQFILLNSLQGPNGQQSFILCPVDGTLPSGVQPKNSDSKATPCKKGNPPHTGKSSVSAGKKTSAANVQDLKSTEPKKADVSTKSDSAEKSDNEVVKDAVPPEISVEGNQGKEKSSITEEVTETPVNTSENVPYSNSTKNISIPLVSILKNKSDSTDETNVSLDTAKKPKQVKKRAPRKPKLPVGDKALPVTSSSTTTPNAIGTILRNNVTGQQIMVPMNLVPGLTNINSPMNNPDSIPMPVAGNVLCNSLTPGMSYIQINNTLIPISTPGGPNLNSNLIITTPVSSSNPQTSQSVLSFSALTQPSTAKTLVVNTPTTSVAGSVPGNALNKVPNSNLSVFVIPQTGGKSATSMPMIPISGVQAQNIGKPITSGQMSKPTQIISNSPRLQNNGNIRPPLIQTNAQFVPPRLLAVAQLCQRLNTPGSPGLTPIRGLGPVAPNPSQVKTVKLPVPSSTTCPLAKATSDSSSVNSVVANSGSISSTTAISIPSNPIPHPQKPGSFIFESSGDFFVLEPIEDSKQLKSVLPVEQSKDLKSGAPKSPKVQSKVKANVIARDTVRSPLKFSPKNPVPDSPKEDTKIEVKLPKPRNYSRFYDGKKVSTLAQKRMFKEEDSDILQKVKYYNLEMKYLTSQAECKRLKLELAKSNMKKKESVETEPIILNGASLKENVPDELIINQLTKHILNKIEEDEAITTIRNEEVFQVDLNDNKPPEIEANEEPMDYEDINNEIQVDQPKEVTNIVVEESLGVINKESEDINEIHGNSDMPIDDTEFHNALIDNDNIPEQSMDSSQAGNQSMLKEIPASSINISGTLDDVAQNRELVNECLDSFEKQPEITSISETGKTLIDQNLTMDDKSGDLISEQVTETKDIETRALKDVQYFVEEKPSEKPETDDIPFEDQSAQQTLKDLEIKYGEEDLDVYTMIRTSVLRSLYADMQDLCEQNKKLFEELQSLKKQRRDL
ncbi:hypothetical protein JTE90_023410 [Oedothorax gibbosus]|uniref:C2H2-type domain-containing protein n=1 Tax=Oedothorax gibbosus TaxID=931172 RepID=A0AAV6UHL8_9ARAC|nr:hypothetical protein JTE90_023410 [Oedothorax gibbosus]